MTSGEQSASWWDAEALINRLAANEEEVRRNFWRKLRHLSRSCRSRKIW